jgi:hypothetical protein
LNIKDLAFAAKQAIAPLIWLMCPIATACSAEKMTGHYMAACQAKRDKIKIIGKIKWFYTHEDSRHGFCDNCGAHMFWQNDSMPTISVTAGSLQDTKNLTVKHNIFTEEKGCYYTISPNEPQSEGYGDSRV